jgi:hypothetical protein
MKDRQNIEPFLNNYKNSQRRAQAATAATAAAAAAAATLRQLALDLGFRLSVIDYERPQSNDKEEEDDDDGQEKQTEPTINRALRGLGNVMSTGACVPITPTRILTRMQLHPKDRHAYSPSHQFLWNMNGSQNEADDKDAEKKNAPLDRIKKHLDALKASRVAFTSVIEGLGFDRTTSTGGSSSSRSSRDTNKADRDRQRFTAIFMRNSRYQLERDLIDLIHDIALGVYYNDEEKTVRTTTTTPPVGRDALAYLTYAREAAIHPDILLASLGFDEVAKLLRKVKNHDKLAPALERVLAYYEKRWTDARAHVAKMSSAAMRETDYILSTAHLTDSTRLDMLGEYLETSLQPDEKLIVFCDFNQALEIARRYCQERCRVPCRLLTGKDKESTRYAVLAEMASRQAGAPRVLFASSEAYCQSGNMTWANHVIHLTTWWNMTRQLQGDGRIDRPGQTKPVFSSLFILGNSIDVGMRLRCMSKDLLRLNTLGVQHCVLLDKTNEKVSVRRVYDNPKQYLDNNSLFAFLPNNGAQTSVVATATYHQDGPPQPQPQPPQLLPRPRLRTRQREHQAQHHHRRRRQQQQQRRDYRRDYRRDKDDDDDDDDPDPTLVRTQQLYDMCQEWTEIRQDYRRACITLDPFELTFQADPIDPPTLARWHIPNMTLPTNEEAIVDVQDSSSSSPSLPTDGRCRRLARRGGRASAADANLAARTSPERDLDHHHHQQQQQQQLLDEAAPSDVEFIMTALEAMSEGTSVQL